MAPLQFPDVPAELVERLRAITSRLPEVVETTSPVGREMRVRRRIFAYLFAIEDADGDVIPMLVVRADPEERHALLGHGHPYFATRSGIDRVGIVLEDGTDWSEMAELVTESYRLNAPKKLVALLDS